MKYKRVLLKLSGETLAGKDNNISVESLEVITNEIINVYKNNIQLGIVIGAGNIWRGAGKAIDRVTADHIGMIATIMNSLALCDMLRKKGIKAKVQSAIEIPKVAELFTRDTAVEYLENGNIVIFAGGTGNPFFTTDTTAALKAAEIKADVLLKATQVDGVYNFDPRKNADAVKYDTLTFDEALGKSLKIMDAAAFSLCKENNLPIIVFDFYCKGNLEKILSGHKIGTLVS